MKNSWVLGGSIKSWIWQNFNYLIRRPSTSIFVIILVIYFVYIIVLIPPNYPDLLGHLGLFLGLIALIYAKICADSSKEQLDAAQRGLNKIQLDYWITRGNDLYKEKKYLEADISFERAFNIDPTDIRIWINKASSLEAQNRFDDALVAINKAINIDSNNADAWNIKGVILSRKGIYNQEKMDTKQFNRCMDMYKIPFIIESMFFENYIDPDHDSHGTWHNRRDIYLAQSIIALKKAIKIRSDEIENKPSNVLNDWLATAWSNLGISLCWLNEYDRSIKALNKAIEIKADYSNIWFNKGVALQSSGHFSEAIRAFDEAIRLNPMHQQSWYIKGLIYLDIANSSDEVVFYANAIRCFDRAIDIDPLDQDVWINRGVALSRNGDNEEAINSMNKAIEINPKNHYAWLDLGICFIGLGNLENALYSINRALELYNIKYLYWSNEYNSSINDRNLINADNAYNNAFILKVETSWILTFKGDIISQLALWNRERFFNALTAYDEAIEKFEFNILARCGKCIALNLMGNLYYSRKAYFDAVSFAYLLNQNSPYIDAFELPRYWRPSSNIFSQTSHNHN